MAWDTGMITNFTDGNTVDEGDLDPIVANLSTLRYATVFEGGQRRTTAVTGIAGTEVQVLQTPSIVQENGRLYRIEGLVKWSPSAGVSGTRPELRVHQGTLAGSNIQSFASFNSQGAEGYGIAFGLYVKAVATASQQYTIGFRRLAGTETLQVDVTSWVAILRSGDSTLMTDA